MQGSDINVLASRVSSKHGKGKFDCAVRIGINEDPAGIEVGKAQLMRALEMVEFIHSRRSAG